MPIVFVAAFDPVGNGFAKSLARPGLNMTGVSNNVPNIAPRQLELVRLAVPHASRIAVVLNHRNRATAAGAPRIRGGGAPSWRSTCA